MMLRIIFSEELNIIWLLIIYIPLFFNRADGAYLYHIDCHKYIDFLQAGGPTVLGYNPKEV